MNDVNNAAEAAVKFLAPEGASLNGRFKTPEESMKFFVTKNAGGQQTSMGETKASEVLARLQIGDVPASSDEFQNVDLASNKPTPQTNDDNKKTSMIDALGLGDLSTLISLGKGDFSSLTGQKTTVSEETQRIKDIMKKIL